MADFNNEDEAIQYIFDYVKGLHDLTKQTLDRVDAMENLLYKEILEPAKKLSDDYERGVRHDAFMEKHGEQLRGFNDKLKAIEGDDFDLAENTFKDYDESDHSIAEDEYVAALIAKVQAQLDKITAAFGGGNVEIEAKDEDKDGNASEVTIETDKDNNGEGDTEEVKAVDVEEKADEENKEPEEVVAEETKEEDKPAEDPTEEIVDDEAVEAETDTPEEIEALIKELEEEKAKEDARG